MDFRSYPGAVGNSDDPIAQVTGGADILEYLNLSLYNCVWLVQEALGGGKVSHTK